MSFCEHCEGQRYDRARVLRVLRQLRRELRQADPGRSAAPLDLALKKLKSLDIPHLELMDEGDGNEIVH